MVCPFPSTAPPSSFLLCTTLISLDARVDEDTVMRETQQQALKTIVSLVGTQEGGDTRGDNPGPTGCPCAQSHTERWAHPAPLHLIPPACTRPCTLTTLRSPIPPPGEKETQTSGEATLPSSSSSSGATTWGVVLGLEGRPLRLRSSSIGGLSQRPG